MAKSQYNGDSPFPSPFSEHPGMSGSPETIPVTSIPFPTRPAIEASSMPAAYILKDSAAMYIGKTVDCARRLRDRGAANATPCPDGISPSTPTSSID
ncbi:hypothetical protein [Bradyrhizobium sp. AZCC 2289]|uniref:hypothetical protein n=1 Tax=Bradyrhizobium sp. AZCC 2289 TaxID=3117026 RepID=UPI002FF207EF